MDEPDDEFAGVGITNCPRCLTPLDVVGGEEEPYLLCSYCGLVRMTA